MNINTKTPRKALNKAYLKQKPNRSEIEAFKANISYMLEHTNESESEEYHKNLVSRFLRDTWYSPGFFINTKGRNDLVIHNGSNAKSLVGVIVETKKPGNKAEMISRNKINTKAFRELMLYYLRERIRLKNLEIKHLVITDIHEWFIFDANTFEKLFAQNKKLVKQFNDFEDGRLAGKTTDFFYNEIAAPFIDSLDQDIEFAHFCTADYEKPLKSPDKERDTKLIALYKLLSPEHMLKLPFTNDSNTLNKDFYTELLHIIGLTENKKGNKKLIERKQPNERNKGSLLENAIDQVDMLDKINYMDNPSQFGDNHEERLFNIGLELCITWINRILFLKLMEAQLLKYHNGDKSYEFLNLEKIKFFGGLGNLFFNVLAKTNEEREESARKEFSKVPYLNSSLFEVSEIEAKAIFIGNLRNDRTLPLHPRTVLKDSSGKRKTGEMSCLQYLLEFLGAYDFSSEGSEEIQEENKSLINASVLGLIFEKINGYRDGSFFTPGFITMYMCRETIRRAILQKFSEAKGWECKDLKELYNKIDDRDEANTIINSLKICDPAVGSGHFLVSALNEIIAIKSELNVLSDRDSRRLKEYNVEVVNDELVITDEDGKLFEYKPGNNESQRVQETLFYEKLTIIENCLFGVDINPNSAKICRLRLWIELLKNAYYKIETGYTELETLPNIDINIKCGNSLISRFPLDADLSIALRASKKWNINSYRIAVETYRKASDREEKRAMVKLIDDIKNNFRTQISRNDPIQKKLDKLGNELFMLTGKGGKFGTGLMMAFEDEAQYGDEDKNKKKRDEKIINIEKQIEKLTAQKEEVNSNKIYENAFEWRFEFPEVLDDEGGFIGFDVVIGNPPYVRAEELGEFKSYLKDYYAVFNPAGDIFSYFYELSYKILRENGKFCFINNTFDKTTAGKILRKFVSSNYTVEQYIDFTSVVVFEEATTYPIVLLASKKQPDSNEFRFLKIQKEQIKEKEFMFKEDAFIKMSQGNLTADIWNFSYDNTNRVLDKMMNNKRLKDVYGKCYRGIITGLNEAFIINKKIGSAENINHVYDGKDIKKWHTPHPYKWMIVFEAKSTRKKYGNLNEEEAKSKMASEHPEIFEHLMVFEDRAKKRYDKGEYWWELRNCAYYDLFEKPKIIFPNLQSINKFAFDETGAYLNAPSVFLPADDKALLGILNSKLIWYFLTSICVVRRGGYIEVKPQYFEQIPIPEIKEENHKILTDLVNKIIQIKKSNHAADTTDLEKQIDRMVYELYGLTEEEIGVVEGE